MDSRVRYVRQSENRGALENFLFVARESTGRYFMWAACDDRWSPLWIEKIYQAIVTERNLAGFGQLAHIDECGKPMKHPANGARLDFCGGYLKRKMSFYVAYEGQGKANLFYALFPRSELQLSTLANGYYDYVILFNLLDGLKFVQVQGVTLEKRIHGTSEGVGVIGYASKDFCLTPKWLKRDFLLATHYFKSNDIGHNILLILMLPVKLINSLRTRLTNRLGY